MTFLLTAGVKGLKLFIHSSPGPVHFESLSPSFFTPHCNSSKISREGVHNISEILENGLKESGTKFVKYTEEVIHMCPTK